MDPKKVDSKIRISAVWSNGEAAACQMPDPAVRRVEQTADIKPLTVVPGYSGRSVERSGELAPGKTKAEPMIAEPAVVTTVLPGQAGESKPAGTVTYVGAGFWSRSVKPETHTIRMAA